MTEGKKRKISRKEKEDSWLWWKGQISLLEENKLISHSSLSLLKILFLKLDVIGYGECQIRPGNLGQLDVFNVLEEDEKTGKISAETRLLFSGLSNTELEKLQEIDKQAVS